jgi:hypothetical protein
MRSRFALLLCIVPALALGQTTTITVAETSDTNNGGRNDGIINKAECLGLSDTFIFTWPALTSTGTSPSLTLWAQTSSDCTATSGTRFAILSAAAVSTTTSASNPVSANLLATKLSFSGCNTREVVTICANLYEGGTTTAAPLATIGGSIVLDGQVPAKPVITGITPGDGALNVSWSAGSNDGGVSKTYQATATPVTTGSPVRSSENSSLSARVDGLQAEADYNVTVVAFSEGGNPSLPSASVVGTPVRVDDFWRHYLGDGGREQGGCGHDGAGLLALLPMAALLPRLRRRAP